MRSDWLLLVVLPTFYWLNSHVNFEIKNEQILLGIGQGAAVATDQSGAIHIVYGVGDSLMYRHGTNGNEFRQPQLIAVIDGLFAFATRGPAIAATQEGLSVIAPTERGNVYSFTKTRLGKWQPATKVTDVDSVNREGFVALASDGKLSLFAAWLDLRGNQRNKIYGARSTNGGKTWHRNVEIYSSPDSTVCECCKVSAVMKGDNVYVMFRNWLNQNRDLHVATSSDGGRSFKGVQKLGNGSWRLNGCPMDGGSLAIPKDGAPLTVWRRESTIYACQPGESEVPLGEGRWPALEIVNEAPIYTWVEKGKVIYRLADGTKKYLGNGTAPIIKAADANSIFCLWEYEGKLYYSFVGV